jgi:acyl-CoA synthetase (AMP-forming)/AMP-acid ligase II
MASTVKSEVAGYGAVDGPGVALLAVRAGELCCGAAVIKGIAKLADRINDESWSFLQLVRAGGLWPQSGRQIAGTLCAVHNYGLLGAATRITAMRDRDGIALIDELGALSYSELDLRSNAVANAWRDRGLRPGASVAVLARNHRGLLDAVYAAGKCGARITLLNTGFGGAQLTDVITREGIDLLVHDDEFSDVVAGISPGLGRIRAWSEKPGPDTLDALIEQGDPSPPPKTGARPKIIIMTSGTTGSPKGAAHTEPYSLIPVGGLLGKVPFRAREVTECCVPLSHSLGFSTAMNAMVLGSTLVMRRIFDPEATLASLEHNRATALIVVPIMLRRILDRGPLAFAEHDLFALRIIFVGGSQLGATLATRALDAFGPVVYNMYGSTEVAYATIATPADLAAEPGCVGSVVRGSVVKIFGDDDRRAPVGTPGQIFVGNGLVFEGYTGGGNKESIDGLLDSGDIGHFDTAGRLFIDGRNDEMIVSGGENVFPGEVEEALAGHPDISEVAVIGVSDDQYGQRLRSYVVLRPGASLTEQDVKDYVKNRLARFKVPRDVFFVDVLPRNPAGKVVKRYLESATTGSASSKQPRT